MNCATKSVARRVASPSGTPTRKESFVFMFGFVPRTMLTNNLHAPDLRAALEAPCERLTNASRFD
jgi:hypothetical protein